jgi:hypothetical protein
VGLALSSLILAGVRMHRTRTERLAFHRRRFADIAEGLLREDALDDMHVMRIKGLVTNIANPAMLTAMMAGMKAMDRDRERGKILRPQTLMHPEWPGMLYHAMMALTYLGWAKGWVARSIFARLLDPATSAASTEALDGRIVEAQAATSL